ncbi:hypothetical protein BJ912DRAFT_1115026 [Pholiota molesta]|nr:hypothetical protein BJ912DRAFT_1115026 [Pholiota molesta]
MISSLLLFLTSIFRPISASAASKSDGVQQDFSSPDSPPLVYLPLSHGSGLNSARYVEMLKDKAILTSGGPVELSKCMITKLEHMKFKKGAQHEYVVATVKYNDTELRLSIERMKGADLPEDYQPEKSPIQIPSCKKIIEHLIPITSNAVFTSPLAEDMVYNIGPQTYHNLEPSRSVKTTSQVQSG